VSDWYEGGGRGVRVTRAVHGAEDGFMPGFGRASRPLAAGPVAAPPPFSLLLPLPMSLLYTPCGTCGGAWSVWRCGGAWSGAGWAAAQGAARPGAHLGGRAPPPPLPFPLPLALLYARCSTSGGAGAREQARLTSTR